MVLTCNFQPRLHIPMTRRQRLRQKNKNKNKKTKNPIGLVGENNKFSCASHLFVHFFAVSHDYDVKMPTFTL